MRAAAALLLVLLLPSGAVAVEPQIAVSVNSSIASRVLPGWPLLVEVFVLNPADVESLTIAPRAMPWPRAVRLRLSGPDGRDELLPHELTAEPPREPLVLPAGASTRFVVLVPENATAGLATGRHRLAARLEARDSPGWNGAVDATATFEVTSLREADTEQRLAGAILRATAHALREEYPGAKTVLREHLKRDPEAVPALQLMAEILEREGDVDGAFLYAARAVTLATKDRQAYSRAAEPPSQLLMLQRRLLGKLALSDGRQPGATPTSPGSPKAPAPPQSPQPASSHPATGDVPETRPTGKPASAAPASPSRVTPADAAKAKALEDYRDTLAKGDALHAAGDHFEAVLSYERAWRIRYNNKLDVPAAELDERLAKARKARDEKKR